MKRSLMMALACTCWSLGGGAAVHAADTAPCQVQVILFVPSELRVPSGFQPRIDQIVDYSEAFFSRELRRWGHTQNVSPFRRSPDGHVEVITIRGRQPVSQYKPVAVRMEVMNALRQQGKINNARQVWWILVYAGAPPAKFPGYLGGFGPEIGGWAVCNFDTTPGVIAPQALLGSALLEKLTLKGMIHELGHGFQLPHIGPLKRDNAGNTLMGPTHYNYRRVMGSDEDRVYLSEAEAAILSIHPAFLRKPDPQQPLPKVEVLDLRCAANATSRTLAVSGRVRASQRAVYALVGDESDARPGEYWTKTYVGRVGPDGAFQVIVSEPSESNGTLKTWFAFEGGAQTGDSQSRGRDSGIARPYTYRQRQWIFP